MCLSTCVCVSCNVGVLWPNVAGWIKMPLGTEVGLIPGHIVLDGTQLPPPKGAQQPTPPLFGPCLLWPNGWMDEDVTWYGGRPRPTSDSV